MTLTASQKARRAAARQSQVAQARGQPQQSRVAQGLPRRRLRRRVAPVAVPTPQQAMVMMPRSAAVTTRRRRRQQSTIQARQLAGFSGYGEAPNRFLQLARTNPYLAMLIQPKQFQMRLPDDSARASALYTSFGYFDVVGNSNAGTAPADLGKFFFSFRGILGSLVSENQQGLLGSQNVQYSPAAPWTAAGFQVQNNYTLTPDANTLTMCGTPNAGNTAFVPPGLVDEVRCVAMSVWFEFTANLLNDGGNVAAALVAGKTILDVNSAAPPAPGYPQEYRTLASFPSAYEGKLRDGCYVFYKPFDPTDSAFRLVQGQQANDANVDTDTEWLAPTIMISGQSTLFGAANPIIGRIEVIRVFEYSTNSRVSSTQPSPVMPTLITHAQQVLRTKSTAMANARHLDFIDEMMKIAQLGGGVIGGALGGPVGSTIGRALGSAGGSLLGEVLEEIF